MRDLYAKLLGQHWDALPNSMRRLHSPAPFLSAAGSFTVTHARSWLVALAIRVFRLPPAGERMPLRLEVDATGSEQRWERTFDGRHTLVTYQYLLADGRLAERTGPLELTFHVDVENGVVVYRPAGLRLRLGRWRIPLPSFFGPRVTARLSADGASEMNVMVRIGAPLLGEMLTYGGPLALISAGERQGTKQISGAKLAPKRDSEPP
jgi:hypothetical protein